jgi:small-conductance mechanosensitive channel
MPFEPEFKKHLHSLLVEVSENTMDQIVQHKRELLFNARATHNSAATPIAYKDAALHAMEFRVSRTIEKYIEAVSIWGYSIDTAFETEMQKEFWGLTAGPSRLQFPPAIKGQHVEAVQGAYARERQRLAMRLVREGSNRLRELKMKNIQTKRSADGTTK